MTGAGLSGATGGFFIRLSKDISAVEDARRAVMAYLEDYWLDPVVANRVEVILEELVSNVARHARDASHVTIAADFSAGVVAMQIEDDGAAFNPLEKADPPPFTDIASAKLGGQGIPLIKRLSRSVRYDRIDDINRISVVVAAA